MVLGGAFMSLVGTVTSAVLVFVVAARSTNNSKANDQFQHSQDFVDGLKADLVEAEESRRAYLAEINRMYRILDKYRAWGYDLVRRLRVLGETEIPAEPEETQ